MHSTFDIIMEAYELNLYTHPEKLLLCIPNHYNDLISRKCKKAIEKIIENNFWINVSLHFHEIRNTVLK